VEKNHTSEGSGPNQAMQTGSRPVPDPTVLTTQALHREVIGLKELFNTRLNAMDEALRLLQSNADKSPSIAVVDSDVRHLKELTDERFKGVDQRFEEKDKISERLSVAERDRVAAALQAQKELVTAQNLSNTTASEKTESSFAKLITQMQALMESQKAAADDKVDDLKTRVYTVEGSQKGNIDGTGRALGMAGLVFGIGGTLAAIGMLIVMVLKGQ
jgi:galactokinase